MGFIEKIFDNMIKKNRQKNIKAMKHDPKLIALEKESAQAYSDLKKYMDVRNRKHDEEQEAKRKAAKAKRKAAEAKKAEKEDKWRKHINKEYEGEIAEKLLKKELFIDMTKQMLVDAWGEPDDKKEAVFKNKVKLKYRYGKTSTSRGTAKYKTQVNLENDLVVGWKDV